MLDVPGWPGHIAGQHIDIRLTAADGYQTERSYSIASAPEEPSVQITVERIDDGEVSPYLTEDVQLADELEIRGPFGGYFNWRDHDGGPLMLLAGGSGLVPLMAMLRHRIAVGSRVDTRLLLSTRSEAEVLYAQELQSLSRSVAVAVYYTFTRLQPRGWSGFARRIDQDMLRTIGPAPGQEPLIYVCGPTGFVERAAQVLVELGYESTAIRTERFGPSG